MRIANVLLGIATTASLLSFASARFLDCPETAKEMKDCDMNAYANTLIGLVFPGLVCAILTLLFIPIFYLGRCCGCCGGTEPSSGCFCGGGPPQYSTADIIRPKIYTLVLIAMGVGVTVAGLVGSGVLVGGLYDLIDQVVGTPDRMFDEVVKLNESFEYEKYDASTDTVTVTNPFAESDAFKSLDEMRNSTKKPLVDLGTQMRDYVNQFNFITFIIFSLPAAFVALAGLSALCNITTCIPCLAGCLFMFLSFLLWLVFAIFITLSYVFGDIDAEFGAIVNGDRSIFVALAQCSDSTFNGLRGSFVDIETSVSADACKAMADMCWDNSQNRVTNVANGKIYDCGNGVNCDGARFGDIVILMEKVMKTHAQVKAQPDARDLGLTCQDSSKACYIVECAEDCKKDGQISDAGKTSKSAVYTFRGAHKIANTLDTVGGEYGSCETLFALLIHPFHGATSAIFSGVYTVAETAGFSCVTAIMFVYVMSWGSKRFMSLSDLHPEDPDKECGVVPSSS